MRSPQVPQWKYVLSYLWEQHIESAPSPLNPHLYVSLRSGRLQLSTANAVYSYEDRYENFVRAFDRVSLPTSTGAPVLLLGLGLGSIPLILEKRGLDYDYVGVEIDESVVYLAQKYVLNHLRSPLQVITTDAVHFVEVWSTPFDLICVDIFLDDNIPLSVEQPVFLKSLRQLLTPNGLLLYNRLARTAEDLAANQQFFDAAFRSVFPTAAYLDVGGNWILLNDGRFIPR